MLKWVQSFKKLLSLLNEAINMSSYPNYLNTHILLCDFKIKHQQDEKQRN